MAWRAHSLADGLPLTQAAPQATPKKPIGRQLPRLHLSKLLLRRKSTKDTTIKSNISSPTVITTPQTPAYGPEVIQHSPSLYPVSPVPSEHSSSAKVSPHPDLRRVSVRHEDLRLAASESLESSEPSSPQPSQSSTPLLPSPISWGREDGPRSPVAPPPSSGHAKAAKEYKSYADFHVLSFYYGDSEATSLSELNQHQNDEPESYSEESLFDEDCSYVSSSETDETPPIPTERVRRLTACSEESDWLASTMSHGERTKRFNARCCHVVQVPVEAKENQNRDTQAMLATILVGPGKAKLVEISRPSSKQLSRSSNQSSTWAKPGTEEGSHASSTEPVDTSAFSAYDKPSTSAVHAHALHPVLSPPDSLQRLSATSTHGTTAAKAPPNPVSSGANLPTPLISLPLSPAETLSRQLRLSRLEHTLDAITQAFDDSTLLVLTSPTVCALRSLLIPDSTYIETLSKIFPEAREIALSALAAWVILDLYLARVIKKYGGSSGQLTQSDHRTNVLSKSHPHDELNTFAAHDSGELLYTIPEKARSLLGIDNNINTQVDKKHETDLVHRAVIMSECVDAVARTLMEVCRGASWDEDVWNSLRCLVELMEDADGGEGAAWV